MPAAKNVSLDVSIMGREFRVACPEEERPSLLQAVTYLDRKMREIRDSGKIVGLERIAIMAALNIAHDLLNSNPAGMAAEVANADQLARVQRLTGLLDQALAQQDNLF
ncbi:MAG: cell division protein ZapA [Betaproteobacteria bacterium]|nr:cell division protein ZapA [Betaproteobacteria bacterium]